MLCFVRAGALGIFLFHLKGDFVFAVWAESLDELRFHFVKGDVVVQRFFEHVLMRGAYPVNVHDYSFGFAHGGFPPFIGRGD